MRSNGMPRSSSSLTRLRHVVHVRFSYTVRSAIGPRCTKWMRFPYLLGLTWAALALAASPVAARPVLFVGNVDDGTVTVVDSHALKVIGTLDVTPDGKAPQDPAQAIVYPALVQAKGTNYVQGLAVSPDGRTLYVSRGFLGDVAAFDIATRKLLWRFQIDGIRADHLTLSPDGKRLFVSALTSNKVEVIDTATHELVGNFPTGDWPHVLEFTPDGRFVVNGSLGNQTVPDGAPHKFAITVADPQTLQVVHSFSYDAGVRPFSFSGDGSRAYVQFSYFDGFREIDPATGAILRTKTLPVLGPEKDMTSHSDYPNQAAHHGIDISGDGKTICDAATVGNYVALVDRATFATDKVIEVPSEPAEAETSADGKYCFISDRGAKTLSVISFASQREIKRIPTGARPQEQAQADVPGAVLHQAGFALPEDAPLAILRRPYTARDRLPGRIRRSPIGSQFAGPEASRLALARHGTRFYVGAAKRPGGLCLVAVERSRSAVGSCSSTRTLARFGAIVTESRAEPRDPVRVFAVVADGYDRGTFRGRAVHVRNNVLALLAHHFHGILSVSGPGRPTRSLHL